MCGSPVGWMPEKIRTPGFSLDRRDGVGSQTRGRSGNYGPPLADCKPSHAGVLGRTHISIDMGAPCVLGLLDFRRPEGTVVTRETTRLTNDGDHRLIRA